MGGCEVAERRTCRRYAALEHPWRVADLGLASQAIDCRRFAAARHRRFVASLGFGSQAVDCRRYAAPTLRQLPAGVSAVLQLAEWQPQPPSRRRRRMSSPPRPTSFPVNHRTVRLGSDGCRRDRRERQSSAQPLPRERSGATLGTGPGRGLIPRLHRWPRWVRYLRRTGPQS